MDAADLERWRQADVEFERLLGLPVAARPSRLDELDATDPVVCERVRNLLLAHETDGGILDRARAPLPEVAPGALSGRQLGRWQLEHEIGRGGMSVVYRAHALEGAAGRDAAIKILTLGTLAGDGGRRCGGDGAAAEARQAIDGLVNAEVPLPSWFAEQLVEAGLLQAD